MVYEENQFHLVTFQRIRQVSSGLSLQYMYVDYILILYVGQLRKKIPKKYSGVC